MSDAYLVSIERNIRGNGVVEFWRKGTVVRSSIVEDFSPFVYCNEARNPWVVNLKGYTPLTGEGQLDVRVDLFGWNHFYETKKLLNGYVLAYSNVCKQYLSATGLRLFEGDTTFDDLVRLTFDIETTGLDANKDSVILITALVTGQGLHQEFAFYVGDGACKEEEDIIERLKDTIDEFDPDILEGHNIYGFDIPFLEQRMARIGRALVWGRGGADLWHGNPRTVKIGANEKYVEMYFCRGRHILDTYLSVQRYDVATQRHSSFGLKAVCRDLGISSEDRIELDREQMSELWETCREDVITYAIQDVQEANKLSAIVHAGEFAQCKMLPDGLGSLCVTGTGEKINMLMVAQYMEEGDIALPVPESVVPFPGGYVEARNIGKFKNVFKADFESLYPSIMLKHNLFPKSDYLHKLKDNLKYWKAERLKQKRLANDPTQSKEVRANASGLNEAFKILINSMYGYMGSAFGTFNDMEMACKVTEIGRTMVQEIASEFEEQGLTIIEIDTDGVILSSPKPYSEEEEMFIVGCMSNRYEDFTLAHDGRYNQMICLKAKNYILQDYDGKVTIKGVSLKNRGMEALFSDYMKTVIGMMLNEEDTNGEICDDVHEYYWQTYKRIAIGDLSAQEVSRRERISDKTASSPMKKRLAAISSHLSEGDYIQVYEGVDPLAPKENPMFPIEDFTGGDCYNKMYYLKKLHGIQKRFEDIFIAEHYDFATMFPNVGIRNVKLYMLEIERHAQARS